MNVWRLAVPILIVFTTFRALPQDEISSKKYQLSGAEMYRTFCASCHGVDGKGGGPVAEALRKAPPDLTLISQRNKGEFPVFRVTHIIDGFEVVAYHGSSEMPVWGDYFRDNETRDESLIKLRENNLVEYIRSIQQK